eukprot:SAG11_NODE_300_length_11057_cov_5.223469_1_plen_103_part_00
MEDLGSECTSHPLLLTIYGLTGAPNIGGSAIVYILPYLDMRLVCLTDPVEGTIGIGVLVLRSYYNPDGLFDTAMSGWSYPVGHGNISILTDLQYRRVGTSVF